MFKTTEEFGQYLQNLIDRHRKDLSILLRSHGYNEEPTPALLVLLYNEYGTEFVEALATLNLSDDDLLHAEGSGLIGKIGNVLSKGAAIVGKVQDVAGKISGKSSDTAVKPKEEPAKNDKTKKIIITGVIVVVVLVIIFIIVKNRKK